METKNLPPKRVFLSLPYLCLSGLPFRPNRLGPLYRHVTDHHGARGSRTEQCSYLVIGTSDPVQGVSTHFSVLVLSTFLPVFS